MAAITSYKGEALVGRSNYIEWLKEASLFLEVHSFMPYIDGTEKNPLSIKSLYYTDSGPRSPELAIKYLEKKTKYSRNTKRALGAIKSTLSADNIDSLETIAHYFNKLIDASYKSFKSADEYTSYIQSSAIYLKELGYKLPKPFIAILLFKGLSIIKTLYVDTVDKYPELRTKLLPRQNKKSRSNNTPEKTKSTKAVMIMLASHNLTSLVYSGLSDQETSLLILDSGASEHYTYNKDWLLDYKSISNKSIRIANGQSLAVLGKGNIPVKANNNTKLIIKDVFYMPNLRANLISTKELINKGWNIIFKKDLVEIVKNTIGVTTSWRYNTYYLNMLVDFNKLEPIVYYTKPENNKLDLYHKRLNHLNKDILLKTIDNTFGLSLGNNEASNNSISDCEPCFISKFHNIGSKKPMSTAPILSVYDIDIVGPIRPLGPKGEKYFMTITDRGSRGAWVFPIKYKGDAYSILVKFFNMIKTQFPEAQIKALKLDNAKEFKSSKWTVFYDDNGTICEYTSPYSAPQNGIAEILNKYIIERLIAICKAKNIPLFLWPYLVQAIIYIKNRTYNSIIDKTPFEALTDKKPNIGYIKILGSLVYTLVPKETRKYGKLSEKGNKGILIGFESANNFLVYLPIENKYIPTNIINQTIITIENY
ncbi:Retrovirus-related Pol polyprotein from transposon TNT 1-94 [Lachnellula cervina]|uniref:Retrovirus-related Pol polyprotein from transposon TNT 1-94 n=1 Tax=Lachnellula cervina TaxID=1316786 RepID=A0A7D8YHH8_9HELO|nr:Retrovirus-related Pol polyprotein from transposon TNT 1-94 [Lachnellula cervina]